MYYEDDFYNEPSEFEIMVDEFKAKLSESVKDEFKAKMEQLEKENAELQEVKNNFEEIKESYARKEMELEHMKRDLALKARRETLDKLLKGKEVLMYKVGYKYENQPKCDKCNDNREIEYTTPLGRKKKEKCICAKSKTYFAPEEYTACEFAFRRGDKEIRFWYQPSSYFKEEDAHYRYGGSTYLDTVFEKGMDYGSIERYGTFFKTAEECQGFCDYLNSKETDEEE